MTYTRFVPNIKVMINDSGFRPWGMEINQFCMLMHLSQLAGYVVPGAGLILPIVMWATNKDRSKVVDMHGKNILNWIISCVIYFAIGLMFTIFLIGIPIIIAVIVCAVIFSVIGAVKANDGTIYKYPLAIEFIK